MVAIRLSMAAMQAENDPVIAHVCIWGWRTGRRVAQRRTAGTLIRLLPLPAQVVQDQAREIEALKAQLAGR